MEVEPKRVEAGFVFRWMEQSLKLIMIHPFAWLFLISLLMIVSLIPVNIFFKSFIGLWMMLIGLELASTNGNIKMKNILLLFGKATEGLLFQIYFKIIFYSIIFILYALITYYFDTKDENINMLSKTYWTYGLGVLSLSGVGFQIYSHLYSKFFLTLNKRKVNYQCRLASKINYKVEIFFELYIVGNIFLISAIFSNLYFILYPISCAFIYVSFKEIFLEDNLKILEEKNYKLS